MRSSCETRIENGSLESETVKYGHESHGTRTRGPGAKLNDRPVLSSERECPIQTNPKLSDNNKDLVVNPRWVLYSKTDWPTEPSVVT
jgi:hypothetical protein